MTIKNILSFIVLSLISQWALSQTLKTFKGTDQGAEATYQYYENSDYERIFHGTFYYKTTSDNPAVHNSGRVYQSISITGAFKENKKDGLWEGKEVLKSQAVTAMYGNASLNTTVKGSYINGLKTGIWTYNKTVALNKKIELGNYSFNFHKNVLIGTITINDLNGTLDNQGNFTGSWNLKDEGTEYIAEFQQNIFVKLIVRTVSNGNILLRYKNANILNFIADSTAIINGIRYVLKSVKDLEYGDHIDPATNNDNNFFDRDKNQYFKDFYKIISERIGNFDKTIEIITRGSTSFLIVSPKVPIIFQ